MSAVLVFLNGELKRIRMESVIAYFCEAGAKEEKCGKWESWFSIWGRIQDHARREYEVGILIIQ